MRKTAEPLSADVARTASFLEAELNPGKQNVAQGQNMMPESNKDVAKGSSAPQKRSRPLRKQIVV